MSATTTTKPLILGTLVAWRSGNAFD